MKWQMTSLMKTATSELQASYQILVDENHVVPRECKVEFAHKVGKEYALESKFQEYIRVVSLELPGEGYDFILDPTFGSLLPSRTAPAQQLLEFWTAWRCTVLSDAILGLVQDIEKDGIVQLETVARDFIKGAQKLEKDLPEYAVAELKTATQLFRGLLALIDPWPGVGGSTQHDVEFLAPLDEKTKTDVVSKQFGAAGQSLQRNLKTSSLWKGLLGDYRKCVGAITRLGKDIRALMEEAETLLAVQELQPSGIAMPSDG